GRADDAADEAPDEDDHDDGRHDEEGGDAEPGLHAQPKEFERQRARQADQPGDSRRDQEADDDPPGEPDQGVASVAGARAWARSPAMKPSALAWPRMAMATSPAADCMASGS